MDYDDSRDRISNLVATKQFASNEDLQRETGLPRRLVDHILTQFESQGLVGLTKFDNDYWRISHLSATFRRAARRSS